MNANKISLNTTSKTEYIYFNSTQTEICQLNSSWKKHVSVSKLRRANGALETLRHFVQLKTLTSVYHVVFNLLNPKDVRHTSATPYERRTSYVLGPVSL